MDDTCRPANRQLLLQPSLEHLCIDESEYDGRNRKHQEAFKLQLFSISTEADNGEIAEIHSNAVFTKDQGSTQKVA